MDKEEEKLSSTPSNYKELYADEKDADFAYRSVDQLNNALEKREQNSLVTNGMSYSVAYVENQKKAINFAPSKKDGDRKVSFGIPHEKIISFCAIFLKYMFRRKVKARDEYGNVIEGVGTIYDLAIEHSHKLERFKRLIALVYWELFSQGNAFVYEDWEVRNEFNMKPMQDGKPVNLEEMEYTYEYLDGLTYEQGEEYQTRRAVSRLLDGRNIIFANPEIEDVQDQTTIWLEFEYDRLDAEAMFGSLKMWEKVPKESEDMTKIFNSESKITLFNASRLKEPKKKCIVHYQMDKAGNTYNVFVNGVMMLSRNTPFRLFYPRNNYPITNVPAERLSGSIYARGIPAKTKFNADYIDWALLKLAEKFEQGIDPALLVKGKYVLTKDLFKAGQRTHDVSRTDFEQADPENKGITNNEVTFVQLLKTIIENQTVNATTSGEISGNATATEIATLDQNQRDKLGFMLDGLVNGFTDMYMRRAETIETKYTKKQKETLVDGKLIPVYQNFSVSISGVEHSVVFDPEMGLMSAEDIDKKKGELFEKSFKLKKQGKKQEFYIIDPSILSKRKMTLDIEVYAEKIKDSQLQMISLWEEFTQLINVFGDEVNREELKKMYLETSNRSDTLFAPVIGAQQAQPMGGQPRVDNSQESVAKKRLALGSKTK